MVTSARSPWQTSWRGGDLSAGQRYGSDTGNGAGVGRRPRTHRGGPPAILSARGLCVAHQTGRDAGPFGHTTESSAVTAVRRREAVWWRVMHGHAEAATLLALLGGVLLWANLNRTNAMSSGYYAIGVVGGAAIALNAIGLVLVYRANRVINLAQLSMAAVGGDLFLRLVQHRSFVRLIGAVCPGCLPTPRTVADLLQHGGVPSNLAGDAGFRALASVKLTDPRVSQYFPANFSGKDFGVYLASGWMVQLNYWLSFLAAIVLSMVLVWTVYILVIKRFNNAPRLILTVVTLAAGSFAGLLGSNVLGFLFPSQAATLGTPSPRLPIDVRITIFHPAVLSSGDVLAVLAAAIAAGGLALYLKRGRSGVVLRGASENAQRAQTLGVNVGAVTARAWIIAGGLSGLASVLALAQAGVGADQGSAALVRALAAAVVGGLVGLPLALLGALVLGVVDSASLYASGSENVVNVLIFAVVVVLLLVQRRRTSRAEAEATVAWQASRELRPIPRELRQLPQVRSVLRVLVVLGVLIALGYPWVMSPSQTLLGSVTMVQAVLGLSLLVLTGWAGQISLGQMGFAAAGAYAAVSMHLPFALALPAGALCGCVMAGAIGIPALRLRGLFLAIITLAFGLAISSLLLGDTALGRRSTRTLSRPLWLGINFADERSFYYLVLVLLGLAVAATVGLRRSRTARALIACKDHELAAQSFGINVVRARLTAFAISGAMAGTAGVVLAFAQRGIQAPAFAPDQSIQVFFMSLIGGQGSVAGPVVGAVYLAVLHLLSSSGLAGLVGLLASPGIGVLALLIWMPGGVIQGVYLVRDAWLRRLAARLRISVPSLGLDAATTRVIPIQPNLHSGGGEVLTPHRYRLAQQWMVSAQQRDPVANG
jgi:branched-chain amino acid transport system permease protein